MVADRVYGRRSFEGSNGRTSLLHFAAAVPMVGFVNGAATDLNRANFTGFEGYAEARFRNRAHRIDRAARPKCATKPSRWPLGLPWFLTGSEHYRADA
jgi:hypothetical protein